MKRYITKWRKGDKKGTYATKSLTSFHQHIHETSDSARTIMEDHAVKDWPFGIYSEVLGTSDKKSGKAILAP